MDPPLIGYYDWVRVVVPHLQNLSVKTKADIVLEDSFFVVDFDSIFVGNDDLFLIFVGCSQNGSCYTLAYLNKCSAVGEVIYLAAGKKDSSIGDKKYLLQAGASITHNFLHSHVRK